MTGFGRADGAAEAWTWTVEARSVNGRSLEARYRGPPGFDSLERIAREIAQSRFTRGQVTIGLQARRTETPSAPRINLELLDYYIALAERYAREGGVGPASIDRLLSLKGVVEIADETDDPDAKAKVEAAMAVSIEAALDNLLLARLAEGAALLSVLAGLVDEIENLIGRAKGEAVLQPQALKQRFARRIRELMSDHVALEERIVQEAAVMASKADVREELDRLTAHVAAARALLAGAGPAGRKLDFLTQEFMREANTLCSKSATSGLTAVGLELKAVIDQFREQVQNVE
jgi:uncharacterized protein (TIGR00255 family)